MTEETTHPKDGYYIKSNPYLKGTEMANSSSAKGNPASKRMTNPNNKEKRAKNERLKETGQHPKQLRQKAQEERRLANEMVMAQLGLTNRKQVRRLRQEQKSA